MARPSNGVAMVNVGFRCEAELYERIKAAASQEKRSISGLFGIFIEESVKRYEDGGLKAVTYSK